MGSIVPTQQTSVSDKMITGFDGMIADVSMSDVDGHKINGEASAEILFGRAVVRGSTDQEVLRPHTDAATSAPLFDGVVVHSHAYAKPEELGDDGLKPTVVVMTLQRGRILTTPEEAVSPGDAVRFRAVVTGNEEAGAFRTTADGTDCVNISQLARWITSGDTNTPAWLEIDMTNAALATADT